MWHRGSGRSSVPQNRNNRVSGRAAIVFAHGGGPGFTAAIPLRRMGTAEECASVIGFLASPAASYVLGETIETNGG